MIIYIAFYDIVSSQIVPFLINCHRYLSLSLPLAKIAACATQSPTKCQHVLHLTQQTWHATRRRGSAEAAQGLLNPHMQHTRVA